MPKASRSLPPTFTRSSSQDFGFLRVFSGAKKAQMASFRSSISFPPPRRTPRRRTAGHSHAPRPSLGGRARMASQRSWVADFIALLSSRSRVRTHHTSPGRRAARAGGGEEHERRRRGFRGRAREFGGHAVTTRLLERLTPTARSARTLARRGHRTGNGAAGHSRSRGRARKRSTASSSQK